MKIDAIRVIQNALIGGTNGDMAFKYNNQFVRELFDNFKYEHPERMANMNYEDAKFRAFLAEILTND